MPVQFQTSRNDGKSDKDRAVFVLPFDFIGADCAAYVAQARRDAIAHREEMLALQKERAAAGDRGGAKFFKEESREALKHYRAACLLLPHVSALSDLPGDCAESDPYTWPEDLHPALVLISEGACYAEALPSECLAA